MADYLSGKVQNPEQWEPKKEADSPVDMRIDVIPVEPEAMVPESQDIPGMIREDKGDFSSELLRDTADACFKRLQKNEERLKRRLQQIADGSETAGQRTFSPDFPTDQKQTGSSPSVLLGDEGNEELVYL